MDGYIISARQAVRDRRQINNAHLFIIQLFSLIDKILLFDGGSIGWRVLLVKGYCGRDIVALLEASKLSGFIAHDLSGLIWSPMEVTDETDRDATGDSEDAI